MYLVSLLVCRFIYMLYILTYAIWACCCCRVSFSCCRLCDGGRRAPHPETEFFAGVNLPFFFSGAWSGEMKLKPALCRLLETPVDSSFELTSMGISAKEVCPSEVPLPLLREGIYALLEGRNALKTRRMKYSNLNSIYIATAIRKAEPYSSIRIAAGLGEAVVVFVDWFGDLDK